MADKNDAVAQIIALGEAAKAAQDVVAAATAQANAAKMSHIQANEKHAAAAARQDNLDALEAKLNARKSELDDRDAANSATTKSLSDMSEALAAREKEIAANEARVQAALDEAAKANAQAKSYEGAAYAKLESVRQKFAEVGA